MKRAVVVSGFPGVGKTTLIKMGTGLRILDSDSSRFSWQNQAARIRHACWPANYLHHVQEHLCDGADLILVSSHAEVRDALAAARIPFVLVYPGLDMKDEYIDRYVRRGNDAGFVNLLRENFEPWIRALMKRRPGVRHVVLRPGEHLADRVRDILALRRQKCP